VTPGGSTRERRGMRALTSISIRYFNINMLRKLFSTAALLVAGLAYACSASTDLSAQIVPAGSNRAVPAPAQVAGFTLLAFESDFAQPFYGSASNWLDCAGASAPQWFRGAWPGFSKFAPCSQIRQATDALTGTPALDMTWFQGESETSNSIGLFDSSKNDASNGTFFTFYYVEVIARASRLSNNTGYALWTLAPYTGIMFEFDGIEFVSGPGDSDAVMHNSSAIDYPAHAIWIGTMPPNISSWDPTQYNKYAWRVTSDGHTDSYFCQWINDTATGCTSWGATPSQIASGTLNTLQLMISGARGGSNAGELWVKSVKIYTCPSWNRGNMAANCYSSSPNP
jgi:hypothetical protein